MWGSRTRHGATCPSWPPSAPGCSTWTRPAETGAAPRAARSSRLRPRWGKPRRDAPQGGNNRTQGRPATLVTRAPVQVREALQRHRHPRRRGAGCLVSQRRPQQLPPPLPGMRPVVRRRLGRRDDLLDRGGELVHERAPRLHHHAVVHVPAPLSPPVVSGVRRLHQPSRDSPRPQVGRHAQPLAGLRRRGEGRRGRLRSAGRGRVTDYLPASDTQAGYGQRCLPPAPPCALTLARGPPGWKTGAPTRWGWRTRSRRRSPEPRPPHPRPPPRPAAS